MKKILENGIEKKVLEKMIEKKGGMEIGILKSGNEGKLNRIIERNGLWKKWNELNEENGINGG